MIVRLLFLLLFGCSAAFAVAGSRTVADSLMNQLEFVLSERDTFLRQKEAVIDSLQAEATSAKSDSDLFDALDRLFNEYHSFNSDSAFSMARRQLDLASRVGDKVLILNARLNMAGILSNTGMYAETLALLDSVPGADVPDYLRPYYYHVKRTAYGRLADYSAFGPHKERYAKLTDAYRDSLLAVNAPNSFFHALIRADQLNVHGRPQEAIGLLEGYVRDNELSEHDNAILAWSLAEAYGKMNDVANQKKYLLVSSISDMKSSVREYVSLRQLAILLYKEGDLDRAYRFLAIAVEDAAKCNARQRIIELNDSYPVINGIYVETIHGQKKALERTIIIITVLTVILICLLVYMRKQMLRIADGRRKVVEANDKLNDLNSKLKVSNDRLNGLVAELNASNEKLQELNIRLKQSNEDLHEANRTITSISELKEVYICKYMEQSLAHIEMLDNYRKIIGRHLSAGKIADLTKMVKSTDIVDDELKAFYEQFDKTFLSLFPTFVEDFNSLLLPGEAIVPKKAGFLNTELRIYALIRLGISDSDKIAKFLRYSLTTIYNYRTKVRNKAKGDRNLLESEVVKIGQ